MGKIILAEKAGFCFGVKRAIEKAYENYDTENVYTYGSLIHNKEVMNELGDRGIIKVDNIEEFKNLDRGIVIIRSHGITEKEEKKLNSLGYKVIDTTCPYVKKIHKLVNKYSKLGYEIIIFGDKDHPEIKGIVGWSVKEPIVINNEDEVDSIKLDKSQKGIIVAQTTFNTAKFLSMLEKIRKKQYNIIVLDTICSATQERQDATRALSKEVDLMIVVGDKNSSNTQKLYDISSSECRETIFIQTASNMDFEKLKGKELVGITAGASTPNNIIEEVMRKCQKILDKC